MGLYEQAHILLRGYGSDPGSPQSADLLSTDHLPDHLTGLPDALADRLRRDYRDQGHISVVGIDTDMCVLKIAMDIFDLGIEPVVYVDCCASTAGLQAHLSGLAILSRNIGPHQLRLTRLHEGYLAAPKGDPTPTPTPP